MNTNKYKAGEGVWVYTGDGDHAGVIIKAVKDKYLVRWWHPSETYAQKGYFTEKELGARK